LTLGPQLHLNRKSSVREPLIPMLLLMLIGRRATRSPKQMLYRLNHTPTGPGGLVGRLLLQRNARNAMLSEIYRKSVSNNFHPPLRRPKVVHVAVHVHVFGATPIRSRLLEATWATPAPPMQCGMVTAHHAVPPQIEFSHDIYGSVGIYNRSPRCRVPGLLGRTG
jgi:hypothetical protein